MKFSKLLAVSALAAASVGAMATPAVTFRVDGDTFAQSSFTVRNQSDNMERITRIAFDLTGFGFVFDTAFGGPPGNNTDALDFTPDFTQASKAGLITPSCATNAALAVCDGASLLDISFSGFDPDDDGVAATPPGLFSWGIDIDSSNGNVVTVKGSDLAGVSATIWFSNGGSLTGLLALDTSDSDASYFSVSGSGVPPPPPPSGTPEPGSLALVGLALLALGSARARRR